MTSKEIVDLILEEGELQLYLSSCGNPDHGQYSSISPPFKRACSTLDEATRLCQEYIKKWDLGGGNWSGGQVYKGKVPYAYISFNGRVWPPDKTGRKQFSADISKGNHPDA